MTATYAIPLELVRFLNIEQTIPDRKATGSARAAESIGNGDGSTTLFYTDKAYIVDDSYSFSHGSAEAGATALTETTHYTLDKDNGTLTITTAGNAAIGTGTIFGKYSYNDLEITNSQLQDALNRAQEEIDNLTNNHFATGGSATPDYIQVTNEKHTGKGKFDRGYYLEKHPLPDVSTGVSSIITAADTTITVYSTDGFLNSGIFQAGDNKIVYTGKTPVTFTGCTEVINGVSAGVSAYPFVFEVSTESGGNAPTWSIMEEGTDYDLDLEAGRVHIYRSDIVLDSLTRSYPPRHLPNRFRATYIWGNDTIPQHLRRACMMIASKDLMNTANRKAAMSGQEGAPRESITLDDSWIERTLEGYKNRRVSNI